MKITLVRHAEVIKSYQGKYNGHIDIPLSENGKLQAIELAKKLQDEEYDSIYCSDLLRAKETLEAFKFSVRPLYSKKLREKSWGVHEGKSFEEIEASGIMYENFEQWIDALDGEDIHTYKTKVEDYFYTTILKTDAKNILVVTHSGFVKTLLSIKNNIPLKEAFTLKLPYASYIQLNF